MQTRKLGTSGHYRHLQRTLDLLDYLIRVYQNSDLKKEKKNMKLGKIE